MLPIAKGKLRFPGEMWGAALGQISEGMARDEGETLHTEGSARLQPEATGKQSPRTESQVKTTPDAHGVGRASSAGEVPKW